MAEFPEVEDLDPEYSDAVGKKRRQIFAAALLATSGSETAGFRLGFAIAAEKRFASPFANSACR
jgi:hypothetical protein